MKNKTKLKNFFLNDEHVDYSLRVQAFGALILFALLYYFVIPIEAIFCFGFGCIVIGFIFQITYLIIAQIEKHKNEKEFKRHINNPDTFE